MSYLNFLPTVPRVWIGCLACYNAGRLTGDWFEAATADEVTVERVHGRPTSHEELWCFDHEGLPVTSELSPQHAARLIGRINEVDEHLRDAFRAWVHDGNHAEDAFGLPIIGDFQDRYAGQWESFATYAHELGRELGVLDGVPEEVERYFDWEAWTKDLALDYTVLDAPDGGVYVIRNH